MDRAAAFAQRVRHAAVQIRVHGGEHRARSDRRQIERAFVGQKRRFGQSHRGAFEAHLGFLDRREAAQDDDVLVRADRAALDHRLQHVVLALRVGGIEAVEPARVHAHAGQRLERFGATGHVHLENFRRAGRAQKNRARLVLGDDRFDQRPQRLEHVAARQVVFVEHRGREARLGEDHHAQRCLQKPLTRVGADDEEEAVLHLVVQPADRRERTEVVALDRFGSGVEHDWQLPPEMPAGARRAPIAIVVSRIAARGDASHPLLAGLLRCSTRRPE